MTIKGEAIKKARQNWNQKQVVPQLEDQLTKTVQTLCKSKQVLKGDPKECFLTRKLKIGTT